MSSGHQGLLKTFDLEDKEMPSMAITDEKVSLEEVLLFLVPMKFFDFFKN